MDAIGRELRLAAADLTVSWYLAVNFYSVAEVSSRSCRQVTWGARLEVTCRGVCSQ